MSSLASCSADILDRLAECVNGPVLGTVTSTSSAGVVVVPRGQLGTLSDGRIVRCTRSTRVPTTGAAVPVRQLFLTPAHPVAGNFAQVPEGTTVTWTSPPTHIAATGTIAAGGMAPVTGAALVSIAELEQLGANFDPFAAGAQGSALGILLAPEARRLPGSERVGRRIRAEITWRLRVNLSTLAGQGQRRATSRDFFDSLVEALEGASVAGSILTVGKWSLARQADGVSSHELAFAVQVWMRGRVLQSRETAVPFTTLGQVTHLDPAGQLPAEQTAEDIAIPQP